nr:uncharacterized protein LOC133615256 isoform X2 [Nerophis lumbriciformis]
MVTASTRACEIEIISFSHKTLPLLTVLEGNSFTDIQYLTFFFFVSSSCTAGCEYESVCPLFGSTPPVTTTPSTTTPSTTTPSTTTPSTTTPSTTTPSTTTTPLGVMVANANTNNESVEIKESKSSYVSTLEVLLALSSSFALVLPVVVYVYMRRQTRQLKWTLRTPLTP